MVLTASFVLSPVTGLVCHRRLRIKVLSAPGRADQTSANLTPASGRQDHTTSPSAASISRQRAVDRSQIPKNPPCDHLARSTLPRPPHPIPTFVTMANAPLVGRDARSSRCDLGWTKTGIFLQRGMDTPVNKQPVGQITDRAVQPATQKLEFSSRCAGPPVSGNRTFLTRRSRRTTSVVRAEADITWMWQDFSF